MMPLAPLLTRLVILLSDLTKLVSVQKKKTKPQFSNCIIVVLSSDEGGIVMMSNMEFQNAD